MTNYTQARKPLQIRAFPDWFFKFFIRAIRCTTIQVTIKHCQTNGFCSSASNPAFPDGSIKRGTVSSPAVDRNSIASAVETVIRHYLRNRLEQGEHFLTTLERVGINSFKEVVYG